MRPILTLTVLVAVAAGVTVGCKQSQSKETKNATSTTTTQQPATNDEAERKRLADQNASLEAEKRRLEEEQKKLQAELDKAKANTPPNTTATNHCGSIVRNNNNSSFLACREYGGYDQANITRLQQQCVGISGTTGIPNTGNPTWDQLIQIMNQNRGGNGGQSGGGTWGNGGCPRTVQGSAAVGTCKFVQGWSTTYWDVYYAPWTSANAKSDCEQRRGVFSNP